MNNEVRLVDIDARLQQNQYMIDRIQCQLYKWELVEPQGWLRRLLNPLIIKLTNSVLSKNNKLLLTGIEKQNEWLFKISDLFQELLEN
jgi:hypothetical protein